MNFHRRADFGLQALIERGQEADHRCISSNPTERCIACIAALAVPSVEEFVKHKESVLRLFLLNSVADISSRAAEPASLSFTMDKRRLSNQKVAE